MTKDTNENELKKDIKLYTYVDRRLDYKLNSFIEEYEIKSKAMVIRNSVRSYLNSARLILEKVPELCKPIGKKIDITIEMAIKNYQKYDGIYEELKQNLSPLKILIFMLEDILDKPQMLRENVEQLKTAISKLEDSMRIRFDDLSPYHFEKHCDILYVEDNELDRETIKMYFETKGISIYTIETSEEAINVLKYATPKVILLDLDLKTSKLQGKELCRYIKTMEEYKNINVIIMSAYVSKLDKYNILSETLADDIITKPIRELADLDSILNFL